jgi:nicotinamidase-related amidase
MPLTELDEKVALVTIDLQKGIVQIPTAHAISDVLTNAAALAASFRARNLPVVLVNVAGRSAGRSDVSWPMRDLPSDWTELVPELNAQPTDLRVTKKSWGAFLTTDLDAQLRSLGVTQIVLAGVSTSIGVESTARSAYELGYNVVLAADAMTDRDAASHQHSLEKIFPRLGQVEATAGILAHLQAH